jgi:CheY-like chemotaxis protein/MinD-like ATPase involved in chromosome partitioning or flagellar assembly
MAKILFIDDNKDVQKLLHVAIKRKGQHELTVASTGEEGLQAAASQPFDLILLDVMMPGMDGYQVARRLRAEDSTKNLPIIMFTARAQVADAEAGLNAGADAYLSKLTAVDEILVKIDEMLAARRKPAPSGTPAAPPTQQPAASAPPAASKPVVQTPPPPTSRSLCVLGCRGGVGATTLAVNIAAAFARRARQACLIDLWHVGGHIAPMMRLPTTPSWGELYSDLNPNSIGSALIKHASGMRVLAAPAEPQSSGMTAQVFNSLAHILPTFFNEVIFNGSPSLDLATRMALLHAERVVFVLAPEVTLVPGAAAMLEYFNSINVPLDRLRVVLNHPSPNLSLPLPAIERGLNHSIDAILPFDPAQGRALLQGQPLATATITKEVPPYLAGLAMLLQKL